MKTLFFASLILLFQSCIENNLPYEEVGSIKTFKENIDYQHVYTNLSHVTFKTDSLFNWTNFYIIHHLKKTNDISLVTRLFLENKSSINDKMLVLSFSSSTSYIKGEEDKYELNIKDSIYQFSAGYYYSHSQRKILQIKTYLHDLILNKKKFNLGDTIFGVFSVDRVVIYNNLQTDSFTVFGEIRTIVK